MIARVDNSYAKRHFKMDFLPWQQTILDSIDSLLEMEIMATKVNSLRMPSLSNLKIEAEKDTRQTVVV